MNELADYVDRHGNLAMRSGDWIKDCWLLKPEPMAELCRHLPEGEIRESVCQLARLFPASVCRPLVRSYDMPYGMFELFHPGCYVGLWVPLMLGRDLAVTSGWGRDRGLVRGLQRHSTFFPRRVEVGVWASLVRHGFDVRRIPQGAERTPDFVVNLDRRAIALEVKTLEGGAESRAIGEIEHALFNSMFPVNNSAIELTWCEGLSVEVHFDVRLVEGLADTRQRAATLHQVLDRLPQIGPAARKAAAEDAGDVRDACLEGLCRITVTRSADTRHHGVSTNLDGPPADKQLKRLLGTLSRAVEQVGTYDAAVVLVEMPRTVLPAEAATQSLQESLTVLAETSKTLRHLDAVIFQNTSHMLFPDVPRIAGVHRFPWSRLSHHEIRGLAVGAAGWAYSL